MTLLETLLAEYRSQSVVIFWDGKTMNPQMRETLEWLRSQGLPPLPVAPAQDPNQYPAHDRNGITKQDKNGALVPAFTGKNPSYLDSNGIPHLIRHTQYQNQMPSEADVQTWFANSANGIGTLGGWHHIVWIDVDLKQFESQDTCDAQMTQWLSQFPLLKQTFTERTHSGGWRFAIRAQEKTFTNFSLEGIGGKHVGEALGQGRFTVLAPTIGPSGNPYVNLRRAQPVWVERLDAIGLYPVSRRREQTVQSHSRPPTQSRPVQFGVLRLEDLATAKAQAILHGESPLESRSHSLTFALREFYGWENWAAENGVPISGKAEELARVAGAALGIEGDRVERIIQSVPDPGDCLPAAVFTGGEPSAWRRIWKMNHSLYQTHCPSDIRKIVQALMQRNRHKVCEITASDFTKDVSEHIQFPEYPGPSRNWKQNTNPKEQEIQVFMRNARYILRHSPEIRAEKNYASHSKITPKKRSIHGQIYYLESDGPHLVIQARKRGFIFRVVDNIIELSKLTTFDTNCFQAEVSRLQRQHISSRVSSTYSRNLEI